MGLTELTRGIERRLTGDHKVVQHTNRVAVWCEYEDAAVVKNIASDYDAKIHRVENSESEGKLYITLVEQ